MRKNIITFCYIFIATIICFSSCKKKTETPPDLGYNYFPNQAGKYVIYDIDSVEYNNADINANTHTAKADSFKFQLKEKIQSIYYDNQNRPTIRLERYIKFHNDSVPYNQMTWTLRNVWAENRTTTTAEKVEENKRFIKLAFPTTENKTWNGNAQNIEEEWNYYYGFIDKPRQIRTLAFDSVLQVIQHDDGGENIIGRQYFTEQYARNVGLVYKYFVDVESQPPSVWGSPTYPFGQDSTRNFLLKPILNRITKGTQFTMTVNSYGTE